MVKKIQNNFWRDGVAVGILLLVGVALWRPLLASPANSVANDYDGVLVAWIHNVVGDRIEKGEWGNFFEGGIFHPYPYSLTFSDPFITSTVLTLPIRWLTHEPLSVLAGATVLAWVMSVLMVFFLGHELTDDRGVSVAAALAFGLSPIYLHYTGHLQILQISFMVLVWLAIVQLAKQFRAGWFWLGMAAFLAQIYNSIFAGMITVLSAGLWLMLDKKLKNRLKKHDRVLFFGLLVVGLALVPLLLPYFKAGEYYQSKRPITDVMHFSASVDDFWGVFASPLLILWGLVGIVGYVGSVGNVGNVGSVGNVGNVGSVGNVGKKTHFWKVFGSIGLFGGVMSLGPALKWAGQSVKIPNLLAGYSGHIPLPYSIFYFLVPGFGAFRTPSRWIILVALSLTLLGAIGVARLKKRWRYTVLAMMCGWLIWRFPLISTVWAPEVAQYPDVYYWLASAEPGVVMELPIFRWGSNSNSKNETWRMLYQTLHHQPLVNGYSGYSPLPWEEMVARMRDEFPSEATWNEIEALGVRYVVVHRDEYEKLKTDLSFLRTLSNLRMIEIGEAVVYQLY